MLVEMDYVQNPRLVKWRIRIPPIQRITPRYPLRRRWRRFI